MEDKILTFLYIIFIDVGIFIMLYHLYRLIYTNNEYINYLNIFIFGPLLICIGLNKDETPEIFYQISLFLAIISFGYHFYFIVKHKGIL